MVLGLFIGRLPLTRLTLKYPGLSADCGTVDWGKSKETVGRDSLCL